MSTNEEWVADAYLRSDMETRADTLEMWARDKALPKELRKEMFAVAWDMKQWARRGTASEGV